MKLVLLFYLEDLDAAVVRLLERNGVAAYSRLPLEGHAQGMPGWYGSTAPYSSRMVFTLVPDDRAKALMEAVTTFDTGTDPRHPIHAIQLSVESTADSGKGAAPPARDTPRHP